MYDVIIIGAGPAGMMASIKAAEHNKKVLLIEKNAVFGKKLLLTGGTRCNVINLKSIDNFIKEIPVNNKALYTSLYQFGPQAIYNYFISIGVPLKVEAEDRVFPLTNKATTIINALTEQMRINNVVVRLNETVKMVDITGKDKMITTDKGIYQTKKIIITAGGCSYPQTGSTGDGYKFAEEMNQEVTKLYPAGTFLVSKDILPLAGITLDNISVSLGKKEVHGSVLFTHIGLSGPAIFKISEEVYKELEKNKYVTVNLDLTPNDSEEELLMKLNDYNSKKELSNFIKEYLPKRLMEYIISQLGYDPKLGTISKLQKKEIIGILKSFNIDIKSTGNITQSFVTGGGVDMKYINPKTMESTINKGIYFAGEVLNVHGHTGGYNITIALSTGYLAGSNI